MKKILLSQGYEALVDEEDFEEFGHLRWYADVRVWKTGRVHVYARRNTSRAKGCKHTTLLLHREIMKPPEGFEVDHIDGNTLDCRRSNMRIARPCDNRRNVSRHLDNRSSKYKGIRRANYGVGKWQACLSVKGEHHYLGTFISEIEAAEAYDKEASKLFGEFARLNFPPDGREWRA